jgi:hypothetical protein
VLQEYGLSDVDINTLIAEKIIQSTH